jgi:hypothetical protein
VSFPNAFAKFAAELSQACGAPFHDATAVFPGVPIVSKGGSIVTPATNVTIAIKAQADAATDGMKREDGFVEGDIALIILRDGLSRVIDTTCSVVMTAGPYPGKWSLKTVKTDPAGIGYECRGRLCR